MASGEENYRKMKQKYLKEQIICEGWDGQVFSEYLLSQREDGTNIDNWDFDELIAQVEGFKRLKKKQEKKTPRKSKNHDFIQKIEQSKRDLNNFAKSNENSNFKKSNKIDFEEIAEDDEENNNEINNEIQQEEDIKNKKEIILLRQVKNKKNRYVFQLLPDKIEFVRKLTDIYWLQNSLKAEFPYYYVK